MCRSTHISQLAFTESFSDSSLHIILSLLYAIQYLGSLSDRVSIQILVERVN